MEQDSSEQREFQVRMSDTDVAQGTLCILTLIGELNVYFKTWICFKKFINLSYIPKS